MTLPMVAKMGGMGPELENEQVTGPEGREVSISIRSIPFEN